MWLSVIAAALVAVLALTKLEDQFLAIFFGYLAYIELHHLAAQLWPERRAGKVPMKYSPSSFPLTTENVPTGAARRVVLLGASNLTKGIGTVVETACRTWGQPLEVHAALGHGRSYGRTTSLLGRQLPGILECGLWPALERTPGVPTAALVTDIGNDLLYGEPVGQIVGLGRGLRSIGWPRPTRGRWSRSCRSTICARFRGPASP